MTVEDPREDELEELEEDDVIVLDDDSVPPPTADGADVDVESLEDALAKKEPTVVPPEEEDDEPGIAGPREERAEPATVKVIPPQPTEFICKRCFLVKHQSQLKDKAKGLCRDCA